MIKVDALNIEFFAQRALTRAEENYVAPDEVRQDFTVFEELHRRGLTGFRNIDEFFEHFGRENTSRGKGRLIEAINHWMTFSTIPKRRLTPSRYTFLSPEMTWPNTLYHATGSAALDGMAKRGTIISSRRALELREDIKTGEFTTHGEHPGLTGVYTTPWFNSDYCLARWFNEHHVVFGLDTDKVEVVYEGAYTVLTPEVPLEAVKVVHAEDVIQGQMREWLEQRGLDVPIREMAYLI